MLSIASALGQQLPNPDCEKLDMKALQGEDCFLSPFMQRRRETAYTVAFFSYAQT